METQAPIYGVIAEFDTPDGVLAAAQHAYDAGYRHMDAYSPFPVEGLAEALGQHRTWLPLIILVGGITGGVGGFLMQYYATVLAYPLNVGGRPLNSWPMYIPITFELTILSAAFAAVIGMLVLNGLPRPYHPVFNAPHFELASVSRFFLCIEASDPQFEPEKTKLFLEGLSPLAVSDVES
jgi:hypothetical protein